MKTFFGGIFIEKEKLEEEGIYHPIKLEYYKYTNNDNVEDKQKYGISIIKTEYKEKSIQVEEKSIKYLTNDENKAIDILQLFKNYQVTPITAEDIINDYAKSLL